MLNQKQEGIIKIVGQVFDIVYAETSATLCLHYTEVYAKAIEDEKFSLKKNSARGSKVEFVYSGPVSLSNTEAHKFGFGADDVLGIGGYGAEIANLRLGHNIEAYIHWRLVESCGDYRHYVIQHLVIVDHCPTPEKAEDLVERMLQNA
ncbi:MAG: hypothetical protein IJ099_01205 [Alphaproteobacteria bacterium]|nr:hypothetical protein [Alphaproteobacteria bacterium]